MTAETLSTTRAGSTFPAHASPGGSCDAAYGTYEIAAAVETGDIFNMCVLPAGARLLSGMFYGDDIDTGTEALDMDIGWAANGGSGTYDTVDTDGLGNLGTLTGDAFAAGNLSVVAALIYPFQNLIVELPIFTKRTTLTIYANTASNAGHVGTVSMVAFYVVEPSQIAA